jgi:hypothetical protein
MKENTKKKEREKESKKERREIGFMHALVFLIKE